ncbi:hypothetical protein ACIGT4_02045 [Streptomyces sioyaensis]|uniref:hypothetical protein n=1 Tax=Streptomyces sioyaensis TaxID=67364 RepID=UPI0037D5666C
MPREAGLLWISGCGGIYRRLVKPQLDLRKPENSMNSELPDLDPLSPADEMALRERSQFTSLLLGGGVLAPVGLVAISVMTGMHLWPTLLNLGGMYGGLWVMIRGWRDGRERLVTLGGWCMAASLAVCLGVLWLLK